MPQGLNSNTTPQQKHTRQTTYQHVSEQIEKIRSDTHISFNDSYGKLFTALEELINGGYAKDKMTKIVLGMLSDLMTEKLTTKNSTALKLKNIALRNGLLDEIQLYALYANVLNNYSEADQTHVKETIIKNGISLKIAKKKTECKISNTLHQRGLLSKKENEDNKSIIMSSNPDFFQNNSDTSNQKGLVSGKVNKDNKPIIISINRDFFQNNSDTLNQKRLVSDKDNKGNKSIIMNSNATFFQNNNVKLDLNNNNSEPKINSANKPSHRK